MEGVAIHQREGKQSHRMLQWVTITNKSKFDRGLLPLLLSPPHSLLEEWEAWLQKRE
jgi:hypothetical protein